MLRIECYPRPLVGIMVTSDYVSKLDTELLSDPNMYMDAARQEGVFAYFFTCADVKLQAQQIAGWVRLSDGHGNKMLFPCLISYISAGGLQRASTVACGLNSGRRDCESTL